MMTAVIAGMADRSRFANERGEYGQKSTIERTFEVVRTVRTHDSALQIAQFRFDIVSVSLEHNPVCCVCTEITLSTL